MEKKRRISIIVILILIAAFYSRAAFKFIKGGDKGENRECISQNRGTSVVFKENYTGLDFVKFESGCFLMGSPDFEKGRNSDEGPVTEISLKSFYISTTEVRKKDFMQFTGETGYRTTSEKEGFSWLYSNLTGNWEKKKNLSWKNPGYGQGLDHPVVHVSFYDALEFAKWLSSKYKEYRFELPSEQEWEYAARGGDMSCIYPFKESENLCTFVNGADLVAKNEFKGWKVEDCHDGFLFTSPSASLSPDKNGLYDMLGNVWEWCNSEYDSRIMKKNNKIYGKSCKVVIRGGSFYSKPEYLRFSSRDFLSSPGKRGYDLGFRLVMREI